MQDFTYSQIDKAPVLNLKGFILKGISAVLFMVAFYSITTAQTTFTFTGESDDRYENVENWTPAYPGTTLDENSVVFIEGIAIASTDIQVNGTLHIGVSGSLELETTALTIATTGKLMNDGELFAASLHNAGSLNNNFSATMDLQAFFTEKNSMTNNLMSAEMIVRGSLTNAGVFNNYSICLVEGDIVNSFSFNELRNSEVTVGGEFLEALTPVTEKQLTYRAAK